MPKKMSVERAKTQASDNGWRGCIEQRDFHRLCLTTMVERDVRR